MLFRWCGPFAGKRPRSGDWGDIKNPKRASRRLLARSRKIKNPRDLAGVLGMFGSMLGRIPDRREEAATLVQEAVKVTAEYKLRQAFGGRTH